MASDRIESHRHISPRIVRVRHVRRSVVIRRSTSSKAVEQASGTSDQVLPEDALRVVPGPGGHQRGGHRQQQGARRHQPHQRTQPGGRIVLGRRHPWRKAVSDRERLEQRPQDQGGRDDCRREQDCRPDGHEVRLGRSRAGRDDRDGRGEGQVASTSGPGKPDGHLRSGCSRSRARPTAGPVGRRRTRPGASCRASRANFRPLARAGVRTAGGRARSRPGRRARRTRRGSASACHQTRS